MSINCRTNQYTNKWYQNLRYTEAIHRRNQTGQEMYEKMFCLKIKTTVRYHFAPIRQTKSMSGNTHVVMDREQQILLLTEGGSIYRYIHVRG